jgi:hypothetical protein
VENVVVQVSTDRFRQNGWFVEGREGVGVNGQPDGLVEVALSAGTAGEKMVKLTADEVRLFAIGLLKVAEEVVPSSGPEADEVRRQIVAVLQGGA